MPATGVQPEVLDVAVVGGGVSGIYSAWRLATSDLEQSAGLRQMAGVRPDGRLKISVFEGSTRIGGRLLSVTPPGMPHIVCELGGMRYMSTQPLVRSLVENRLRLATHLLNVYEPNNIAYLRGQHLRLQELTEAQKVPYQLDWAERGRDPATLISYAIDQIIPGITSMRGAQLWDTLKTFTFQGQHIYNYGFWNLLARSMSREAYEFAQQSGGYDTVQLNWNAADTIALNFDFAPKVTYSALVDGFESVPLTLCRLFQQAGGTVCLQWWLKSFDAVTLPDGTRGVRLTCVDKATRRQAVVQARALILAMPRRALELLDQRGAVLGTQHHKVHTLIQSVTPIPLFKMFVCYHYPWWETVGVSTGRSVTDLPIRQCYYWGVEGRQPGADTANQNAVLLATYDDTLNVQFWAGFRDKQAQPLFTPRPNVFAAQHPGAPAWHQYQAPQAMIEELHRQLTELHDLRFAPEPYEAAYMDWGDDPYGGGVNFWNIHAKSWEVIPAIAQPRPPLPVYICGEAYSNGQGWVEGALETAELVLQNHFHLPPPDWVTADASQ